ncbi:MAG: LysM peptidoglycan-binding domain-containing protein, partial [Sphingomonadales bacterium]|nr:LysM peptidoglycan-binding domain-containing protein [Sphingomonadales bacterium]
MDCRKTIAGLAAPLALAACSGQPARVASTPRPVATPVNEIDAAFDLLMQSREADARKRLKAVLRREPLNAAAQLLVESIDGDPKALLGTQNYHYKVQPGDNAVGLAQRLLGNRLLAYRFLRYNGLKPPVALAAGQELLVPGQPPQPPVVRAPPAR